MSSCESRRVSCWRRLLPLLVLFLLVAELSPRQFVVQGQGAGSAPRKYPPGPDSQSQPGVPKGELIRFVFAESKIFPGTSRDVTVYVPAQYDPARPACVYVNQDGVQYQAPTVFDNLIHRGEMPVTIGVFVMHGRVLAADPNTALDRFNRSYEYDGLGDNYVRFLLEELLPAVETKQTADGRPLRLSKEGKDRAIGGASSGAIAAFTAAWERPDQFRKVLSTIGSFVHLAGGDSYPSLIRKTERKPLRVYLEDASGDLDNPYGNWPLANQQMHAALRYMGYDVRFDYAEGYGHNADHGGSLFPDALRWLWRAETHRPEIVTKGDLASDLTLHRLLVEGEGWTKVVDGLAFADAPCTDAAGNFY